MKEKDCLLRVGSRSLKDWHPIGTVWLPIGFALADLASSWFRIGIKLTRGLDIDWLRIGSRLVKDWPLVGLGLARGWPLRVGSRLGLAWLRVGLRLALDWLRIG